MARRRRLAMVPAHVEQKILFLRGERVMLDADLAALYAVETRSLVRAVKRNIARFPEYFMFQLTPEEVANLRSQTGISSSSHGGRRYRPYVFTEHGVTMLAAVLQSPRAVQVSIEVVRAFVRLRAMLAGNTELARKLTALEKRCLDRRQPVPPVPDDKSVPCRAHLLVRNLCATKGSVGSLVHEARALSKMGGRSFAKVELLGYSLHPIHKRI